MTHHRCMLTTQQKKWNIQLGYAVYKLLLRLVLERNEFKGRIWERDEGILEVRTVM